MFFRYIFILVAVCSCRVATVPINAGEACTELTKKLLEDKQPDKQLALIEAQYEKELHQKLSEIQKEHYDLNRYCLKFKKPTMQKPLCKYDLDLSCQDHDMDTARKLDYLKDLETWSQYAENMCGAPEKN